MAKDDTTSPPTRPDDRAIEELLQAVADLVLAMPREELVAELKRLRREHAEELDARLRPFRTPVTEETMRRSVG